MSDVIEMKVPGKWILAGEHSVLRGYRAVALPRTDLQLRFRFQPGHATHDSTHLSSPSPLANTLAANLSEKLAVFPPEARSPVALLYQAILKLDAWKDLVQSLRGTLTIEGSIPFGAGLGSSASLCVAFTRWLSHYRPLSEVETWELATYLEDQFHGRSSGLDIAVVCAGTPICIKPRINPDLPINPGLKSEFSLASMISTELSQKAQMPSRTYPEIKKLKILRLPHFSFHDSGVRSSTKDCVTKVFSGFQTNSRRARAIDRQMNLAATQAEVGLYTYSDVDQEAGLQLLKTSMQNAQECFRKWDLIPQEVLTLERSLLEQGALATKMVGSGGGGIVVALWRNLFS